MTARTQTAALPTTQTREAWLRAMTAHLAEDLRAAGAPLPAKLRVSVGWPTKGGLGQGKRVIGQCFAPECSKDGHTEIFISPFHGNPIEAGATLLHELVHAAVGVKVGHKKAFVKVARDVGLEGLATATTPSAKLKARLKEITTKIGPFPHASLDLSKLRPVARTRGLKIQCQECGYHMMVTQKWADVGMPTCCCGGEIQPVAYHRDGSDQDEHEGDD